MTRARDIANLVDSNGDIVAGALDNVPAADLVNDTTPQLGGNLDAQENTITSASRLQVGRQSITQAYPAANLGYVADFQGHSSAGQTYISIAEPNATSVGDNGLIIGEDTSSSWITQRGNKPMKFSTNDLERLSINGDGTWGKVPAGTCINTQMYTNSTYTVTSNTTTWVNVWTNISYTPKLNGSKLFLNFSMSVLPEGSNGHDFWLGMYNNSSFSGNVLGQQYWYEISRSAGMTGWNQDQHIMQTQFNTSLGQGNTAYFLLQFRNGTGTGSSYFNYSNAHSSVIITEVAS